MKLTTFLATALAFSAIDEEPVNWQISGTKPLVLQGWGTVRDIYGLARFSQKSNSLSVELAGGGADYGTGSQVAPVVLQEVEGDFEVSVAIQPGINPDGTYAHSNRVLWNAAGLLVEWDNDVPPLAILLAQARRAEDLMVRRNNPRKCDVYWGGAS